MKTYIASLLLALASALPNQRQSSGGQAPQKAAYFLDNNPNGSSIVALGIGADGKLGGPVRRATGGKGSITLGSNGMPVMRDSLQSQGSVLVAGNMLFTVNAGSNTVSMFAIPADSPTQPRLVGRPESSQGEYPLSVAYSEKLSMLCVLNGGKAAGIACFDVDEREGLRCKTPLLPLGAALSETTPPIGPPLSATQIHFTPDQDAIVAVTKGDAMTQKPGYIVSWAVDNRGGIDEQPRVNVMPGLPMAFGSFFLNQSTIVMSDPSFGAAIVNYAADGVTTVKVHTNITGQMAVCWASWEPSLNTAYIIDAAQPTIYTMDPTTGTLKGSFSGTAVDAGFFDAAILDGKMYVLAAGNGVAVFDLATEQEAQYFDLTSFSPQRIGYDGMATWPAYY